jgi:hypothetical protein
MIPAGDYDGSLFLRWHEKVCNGCGKPAALVRWYYSPCTYCPRCETRWVLTTGQPMTWEAAGTVPRREFHGWFAEFDPVPVGQMALPMGAP